MLYQCHSLPRNRSHHAQYLPRVVSAVGLEQQLEVGVVEDVEMQADFVVWEEVVGLLFCPTLRTVARCRNTMLACCQATERSQSQVQAVLLQRHF